MKKRNLFSILLGLAMCFSFSACDDGNKPETEKEIIVTNQEQLIQNVFADELTGKSDVNFTTKGAWTSSVSENSILKSSAQFSPRWISISPDAGKEAGDYTITINLVKNLTGEDRTASITIICGETQITITVTQKGTKEDGTIPEEPSGGAGTFTIADYYSNKILRQVEVDEAKIINGDQIRFYNEGVSIDIDLSMSALTEGSYTWCDRDCSGNFFYTQKGVTDELMWYAQKGVVELSKQDGIYTINVFIDAEEASPENGVRIAISGTYIGYLATE
jgi:hypothetical protein